MNDYSRALVAAAAASRDVATVLFALIEAARTRAHVVAAAEW